MAQINTREVCLLQQTTATTTGTAADIVLPQGYTAAIVTLAVNTTSGTTPTLNVYVQDRLRQAASTDLSGADVANTATPLYDDLIAFAQATTSGNQVARLVGGGNVVAAQKDAALTAGSVASGPIGATWRVKYVLGGTTPSFSFNVVCQFIP